MLARPANWEGCLDRIGRAQTPLQGLARQAQVPPPPPPSPDPRARGSRGSLCTLPPRGCMLGGGRGWHDAGVGSSGPKLGGAGWLVPAPALRGTFARDSTPIRVVRLSSSHWAGWGPARGRLCPRRAFVQCKAGTSRSSVYSKLSPINCLTACTTGTARTRTPPNDGKYRDFYRSSCSPGRLALLA